MSLVEQSSWAQAVFGLFVLVLVLGWLAGLAWDFYQTVTRPYRPPPASTPVDPRCVALTATGARCKRPAVRRGAYGAWCHQH